MEIEVHDIVRASINFNALEFEAILRHYLQGSVPSLNYDAFIYYAVRMASDRQTERERWTDETSLKLISKTIADSGLVGIIEDPEAGPDMIISPSKQVQGKTHNYPPHVDVGIARFYNVKRRYEAGKMVPVLTRFKTVKNPLELYPQIAQFYELLPLIQPETIGQPPTAAVDKPLSRVRINMNIYGGQVPEEICDELNRVVRNIYFDEAEPDDPYEIFAKVSAIGMAAIILPIIRGDTDLITQIVEQKLMEINLDGIKQAANLRYLDELSAINRIKRVAIAGMTNAKEILEIMDRHTVKSMAQLAPLISKKDAARLEQLIAAEQITREDKHCNIHTSLVARVRRPYADIRALLGLLEDITNYDKSTRQYSCRGCLRTVLCRHTIDAGLARNKEEELRKYTGEMISRFVYCKFCNEVIFDNSLQDNISNADFEFTQKSRALAAENQETVRMVPLVFGASASIVRYFSSEKPFLMERLIRAVNEAIYPFVVEAMGNKHVGTDKYDSTVSIYAMIYASIYMLQLYTPDSGLKLAKTSRYLPQGEYAKYFMQQILQRYSKVVGDAELKSAFRLAYAKLKGEYRVSLQYEDVGAKFLLILNSSIYRYLYGRWMVADARESKKRLVGGKKTPAATSRIEQAVAHSPMGSIPRITGMRPNEVDGVGFREKMVRPPAMTKEEAEVYTHTAEYTAATCHVHRRSPICALIPYTGAPAMNYDPELGDKIRARSIEVYVSEKEKRKWHVLPFSARHRYCIQFPVEFIYSADGGLLEWLPDRLEEGKPLAKRSTSGTFESHQRPINDLFATIDGKRVALSAMKPMSTEKRKALVDARNKVLAYAPTMKKSGKNREPKQVKAKSSRAKFEFDEKKLMIVAKINAKNNPIYAKYLGRTEKFSDKEIKAPTFEPIPIETGVPTVQLHYYIIHMIVAYNRLRFNPVSADAQQLVNVADKEFVAFQDAVKNFPALPAYDLDAIKAKYNPEGVYAWQQDYYFSSLKFLYELPFIGPQFAAQIYGFALAEERLRYHKRTFNMDNEDGDEYDQPDPEEAPDENTADAEFEQIGRSNF